MMIVEWDLRWATQLRVTGAWKSKYLLAGRVLGLVLYKAAATWLGGKCKCLVRIIALELVLCKASKIGAAIDTRKIQCLMRIMIKLALWKARIALEASKLKDLMKSLISIF